MKLSQVTPRLLICTFVFVGCVALAAQDQESEKKKGWFDRMKSAVGLGKDEPPPAPPTPPPATPPPPKPKAQPKATSAKKPATSSTSTQAKKPAPPKKVETKPAPKPAPEPAKETPPVAEKKPDSTSKPAETPKPVAGPTDKPQATPPPAPAEKKPDASMSRNLDSEFATLKENPPAAVKPPASAPAPTPASPPPVVAAKPPSPSLPSNVPAAWQIYDYAGHDYVTAESMHKFYRFSEFKVTGDHVWFKNPTLIMKGRVGSLDMLINNIKFVLSNPVRNINGKVCFSRLDLAKLLDPVIRPWLITQGEPFDTVIIDPGHGGHDSGAKGVYGYEKDFTLKLGESTRAALLKRGFKVVMTRQDDRFISLGGRVKFANAIPKSIFISLHFNSASTSASGIETFALTPQGGSSTAMGARAWDAKAFTGNVRDAENIALATAVHAMVMHRFKLIDRGIKRARWSVLTGCTRPGILFEGGFVTNQTEGRLIASQLYREQLANAIADAIMNYRAALHPRTAQQR